MAGKEILGKKSFDFFNWNNKKIGAGKSKMSARQVTTEVEVRVGGPQHGGSDTWQSQEGIAGD